MKQDYREFLRCLRREAGRPTLFEPFFDKTIAQTLIWRSGSNLWDTPSHRTATLISLYEYVHADTVIVQADGNEITEVLAMARLLPEGMRFTVIGKDEAALEAADRHEAVSAVASAKLLSGRDFEKPFIFLAKDEAQTENAIINGAAGIYVPKNAENIWNYYGSHIAVLGGFGVNFINEDRPIPIHRRVRALHELTGGAGYALGSGNDGDYEIRYLGFISMLGMYNELHT